MKRGIQARRHRRNKTFPASVHIKRWCGIIVESVLTDKSKNIPVIRRSTSDGDSGQIDG